jgi:hypothetical protein
MRRLRLEAARRSPFIRHDENRSRTVYDMYPDWGPTSHEPENPRSNEAIQASLDLRDNGGQRPDDN